MCSKVLPFLISSNSSIILKAMIHQIKSLEPYLMTKGLSKCYDIFSAEILFFFVASTETKIVEVSKLQTSQNIK